MLQFMNLGTTRRQCLGVLAAGAMFAAAGWSGSAGGQAERPIVFAIANDISTTDPHRIGSSVDQVFVANVFESLTGRGTDGATVPVLSTEYKISADGLQYEFWLRKNVRFHNGDEFSAKDVVYSWQRAADPATRNRFAPFLVNKIAKIDVVDDYRIVITLKALTPTFLADMSTFFPIVPKDFASSAGLDGFAAAPSGTGPFTFVSRRVQSNIRLAANSRYWGQVPKVGSVDIRIVPDDTARVAMLMAGEADLTENVPPFLIDQIKAQPAIEPLVLPVIQQHFFLFNPKSPVWDLKVRQAIIAAVDVQAIGNSLFRGASTPLPGFCLPKRELGCDGSIPAAAYDPQRAKALLAEAKFDFGRPLKVLGLAPGGAPFSKEIAEAVSSYLGNIGVRTEVILMETGALRAFRAQDVKDYTKHDLIFYVYAALNSDPVQKLSFMRTGGPGSFHSLPEFDARLDKIDQEPDAAKRELLITEALRFMNDQAYVLSLWDLNSIYGKKRDLKWSPPPDVLMPMLATLERRTN